MPTYEAALQANATFYRAFAQADIAAMSDVWSTDHVGVVVIHPGHDAITGRAPVLESWRQIFDGATGIAIEYSDAEAFLFGDVAIVVCHESIGGHALVATNIFALEVAAWRMIHHQAGPYHHESRQQGGTPRVVH